MNPIGRRLFVGAGVASAGLALAYTGAALRLRSTPKRRPDLTNLHLTNLHDAKPAPRVLIVGNSASIGSGFLNHLSDAVPSTSPTVQFSRASASGARLIETLRISQLRALLRDIEWDVVVLQDFSSTALNFGDRHASTFAIEAMARLARPAPIVLFPHWPSEPGHRVYRGGLGSRITTPQDIADYTAISQAHYEHAARKCGGHVAPVLENWLAAVNAGVDLYLADRHHANQTGSDLAARAVWSTVSEYL